MVNAEKSHEGNNFTGVNLYEGLDFTNAQSLNQ